MRIGILGSGLMGAKLGAIFARAGHDVVFSYSRTPGKLARLARQAGARARAGTPREAAGDADAVLIAVNWWTIGDVLRQAGDLRGKVVISCSLPMNRDNTRLRIAHTSSGAEALAKRLRGAWVVSAFGTVPSEVLFGVYAARRRKGRPHLVYCGDNPGAKQIAARLIADAGFAPLDLGPLKAARYVEPFTMLVAQVAYEVERRPDVAYRFEHFRA